MPIIPNLLRRRNPELAGVLDTIDDPTKAPSAVPTLPDAGKPDPRSLSEIFGLGPPTLPGYAEWETQPDPRAIGLKETNQALAENAQSSFMQGYGQRLDSGARTAPGGGNFGGGFEKVTDFSRVNPRLLELRDQFLQQFPGMNPSSGYRDPAHNAAVGGASGSQHIHGNALDFRFGNAPPEQQAAALNWWRENGVGGLGAYRNGSFHVDLAGRRAWGPDYHSGSISQLPEHLQGPLMAHLNGASGRQVATGNQNMSGAAPPVPPIAERIDGGTLRPVGPGENIRPAGLIQSAQAPSATPAPVSFMAKGQGTPVDPSALNMPRQDLQPVPFMQQGQNPSADAAPVLQPTPLAPSQNLMPADGFQMPSGSAIAGAMGGIFKALAGSQTATPQVPAPPPLEAHAPDPQFMQMLDSLRKKRIA